MHKAVYILTAMALWWPATAAAHRHVHASHAKRHHVLHHRAHKTDFDGIEWEGPPLTEAELDALAEQSLQEEAAVLTASEAEAASSS